MKLVQAVVAAALILAGGAAFAQNLVIGTKLELNTLDPHFFSAFPTQSSHQNLFEALVWLDKDLNQHPALATEWKVVDDTTWEFKLRRGVKFHDGSDFDADDVIATLKRVPNVPNSPNSFSQFTKSVKELIKVDSHTLRMKTVRRIRTSRTTCRACSSSRRNTRTRRRRISIPARQSSAPARTSWSNGATANGW